MSVMFGESCKIKIKNNYNLIIKHKQDFFRKSFFNRLVSCTSLGGINIRMLFFRVSNPSEYIHFKT